MEQKTIRNPNFLTKKLMFVNKNDLKNMPPMKNCNLDLKFREAFTAVRRC